ncbi:MAG: N-acetylmuramoyl-L-alanine amidase [Bacillota bacterium]
MSYRGSSIRGRSSAKQAQMDGLALRRNPSAPLVAGHYLRIGERLGIRGDVAYAQALLETNFFRFGGRVQPWQNNYAGLGGASPDQPGASFATPEEGVLAHLQRLYAYATTEPLPMGMPRVDPGFEQVERGSAAHVGELSGRWSAMTNYGEAVDRILGEVLMLSVPGEPYQITQAFLDASSQNRPGACITSGCWQGVRGLVIHRTASPRMGARAIRDYFNQAPDGRYASSQFVVDHESILQLMPVGEVAYHTIGKNLTHLGIETCESAWGTDQWPDTYRRLVWLTAYLVRAFQLDIADVSGHFWWDPVNRPNDPTHLGWKESDGPATGLFSWNRFIADVQGELLQPPTPAEPAPAAPTAAAPAPAAPTPATPAKATAPAKVTAPTPAAHALASAKSRVQQREQVLYDVMPAWAKRPRRRR